jgi:hypothetical protein
VFCFGHSVKKLFAECQAKKPIVKKTLDEECFIFDTRQRVSFCRVFFGHYGKNFFVECLFSTLGKDNLKITFWSTKLIQMNSFQLQICITYQDVQFIFWSFLHMQNKSKFVHKTYISLSLWNYKRDVQDFWIMLEQSCEMNKWSSNQKKLCRSW